MHRKMILLSLLLTLLPHAVLRAQGTPAGKTGWYNGDFQSGIPGQANWQVSGEEFSRTYDDFTVPDGGWILTGLFSHSAMSVTGVTAAVWEIRSGVSAGNGGAVVASGLSPATQTFMFARPD